MRVLKWLLFMPVLCIIVLAMIFLFPVCQMSKRIENKFGKDKK